MKKRICNESCGYGVRDHETPDCFVAALLPVTCFVICLLPVCRMASFLAATPDGGVSKACFSVVATHDIMKVLKRSSTAVKGRAR
ncbi:MAG: hypothetical protein LBF85_06750 [Tannerella sp.]|nr:hypothetical protein [Tannerella sp.]